MATQVARPQSDRSGVGAGSMKLPRHYEKYAGAVLLAVLAQLVRVPLHPQTTVPFITYVPFVLLSAWRYGVTPGLITSAVCLAEIIYFSLELPVLRNEPARYPGLISFVISSALISVLVGRLRDALDALKRSTRELQQANQDLQSYVYTVSHDLQESMRTVALYAQLMGRTCAECALEHPEKDRLISTVGRSARRMTDMLSDLLAYTSVDRHAEPVSVDVGEVVSRVRERLSLTIAEADVQVNVRDPLPVVWSWPGALEQVFQNLLENAIKYRDPQRRAVIDISCSAEKGFWRFAVSDNGIGFDQEYAEKIFGVFKRLHPQDSPYEGTGMGLAVVRRIVSRHGGRVWAQSSPAHGATFLFMIPSTKQDREGSQDKGSRH